MPDLRIGLLDAGELVTDEAVDLWNELSFSFFSVLRRKADRKAAKAAAGPLERALFHNWLILHLPLHLHLSPTIYSSTHLITYNPISTQSTAHTHRT